MIKLKWDSQEVECFNGFGPWMKPAGFQVNVYRQVERSVEPWFDQHILATSSQGPPKSIQEEKEKGANH